MGPTEILYLTLLAKKIFDKLNLNVEFLTGKTDYKKEKLFLKN